MYLYSDQPFEMNGNSKPHTVNSSRILRSRVRRQTSTSHFVSAQSYAKDVYVCIWIFVIHQIFLLFMLSPVYNSLNFCTYISRGFLYSCFELAVEFFERQNICAQICNDRVSLQSLTEKHRASYWDKRNNMFTSFIYI